MNLLAWNCRGLGNTRTVRTLKEVIKSHNPELLFLSETLTVSNKIEELSSKLGYSSFYSVDRQGMGGGLAIFWKHNVKGRVVDSSQNHIDIIIKETSNVEWRLTCFYGFPECERHRDSWDFLRTLASTSQLPWCIFGDFNDLLYISDKKGRHPHPQSLMNGFKNAIDDCSLLEVSLQGGNFTCKRVKELRIGLERGWIGLSLLSRGGNYFLSVPSQSIIQPLLITIILS